VLLAFDGRAYSEDCAGVVADGHNSLCGVAATVAGLQDGVFRPGHDGGTLGNCPVIPRKLDKV